MRILHVLTSPRAEGTPRLVLDWLLIKEHEQSVLFLTSEPDDLLPEFKKYNIHVNQSLKSGIGKIRQIINVVKNECNILKPDIVISWNTGLSQWVLMGASFAGVPKLIAHGGNKPNKKSAGGIFYTYLTLWSLFFLKGKLICCSNYIRDEFSSFPITPVSLVYSVYNCVNIKKFNAISNTRRNGSLCAIMVATLEPHKDHVTLFNAWKIVEEELPTSELIVVGKGSLQIELSTLIKSLDLQRVSMLGSRNDVPELLQQSNIFVFSTTEREGFGTVLIEALASGLPIIATDVPATSEVLQQGRFGFLVPPASPELLALRIIENYRSNNDELVKEGIIYANTFSPKNMMRQYLNVANE